MYQFKNWKLICEEKDREIVRLKEELERVKRMERLTERELNSLCGVYYGECHFIDCDGNCKDCEVQYKADLKLKEYEDLDEQGLLLKLPCKVGTKVFYVQKCLAPSCKNCMGFTRVNNCYTEHKARIFEQEFALRHLKAFGETVFLTKEEAEKALEEMEK